MALGPRRSLACSWRCAACCSLHTPISKHAEDPACRLTRALLVLRQLGPFMLDDASLHTAAFNSTGVPSLFYNKSCRPRAGPTICRCPTPNLAGGELGHGEQVIALTAVAQSAQQQQQQQQQQRRQQRQRQRQLQLKHHS